ncbi:alpha/beta fold hydrolase [Lentibacillus salinarum]|uniref:Alpha/beta fold hydrolase n=1 Tax=Lentibacillus salinarum TaxID=446820 RepID=A0ABW3ZYC6_9BACI
MDYVFIHGLGQDFSSWNKTIDNLDLNSNASCPDLFSLLGTSDPTYNNLYQLFHEYCESFKGPINLCGISLGAILSLNYAIDRPDKVNSLVLIGAQYKMPKVLLTIQNFMFYVIPKSVFLKMGTDKKKFIGLAKSVKQLDFSGKLTDIQCDSLIVCGEKDFANKRASKHLSKYIKGARSVIIQDAGHELNKDSASKLSVIITDFWNNNDHKTKR